MTDWFDKHLWKVEEVIKLTLNILSTALQLDSSCLDFVMSYLAESLSSVNGIRCPAYDHQPRQSRTTAIGKVCNIHPLIEGFHN